MPGRLMWLAFQRNEDLLGISRGAGLSPVHNSETNRSRRACSILKLSPKTL